LTLAPLPGCLQQSASSPTLGESRWAPAAVTQTRVRVESWGDVPNAGLQLPAVSPDGKWIAYLQLRTGRAVSVDSPPPGDAIAAVSLCVRPTKAAAGGREVCESAAAAPAAWSPDSKRIVFVACDPAGRCDLAIHEPATGRTQRLSLPLRRIMMPAIAPSGDRLAIVAADETADRLRVYVVPLGSPDSLTVCPADESVIGQFQPQWTADGRILFVTTRLDEAWLAQWKPGDPPRLLYRINVPSSPRAVGQAFAGLARPLSPDDRRFAYYDASMDRIVLVDLSDGKRTEMPTRTRAGCWLGPQRFATATDEELTLYDCSNGNLALLMRGPWLPRWAGGDGELVLCTRGTAPDMFGVVQMIVMPTK